MNGISFIKMHGLGNDFVVIDGRPSPVSLTPDQARAIAARHTGIGCDQVIVVEPPDSGRDGSGAKAGGGEAGGAEAFMRIHNADGGEVSACGNATRCVAAMLMAESGAASVRLGTRAGVLLAEDAGEAGITVDMGTPGLEWDDIPLAHAADTLNLDLDAGPLGAAAAANMGNPHAVFFVADADAVDLAAIGPGLEHHAMFPERANIGIAEVRSEREIRLRVWERGAGLTLACGTGACAAAVNANRRGLAGRSIRMVLDGGEIDVTWRDDGHVAMTGPVAVSFTGTIDEAMLP
jgi:diaminopimelate epimerase